MNLKFLLTLALGAVLSACGNQGFKSSAKELSSMDSFGIASSYPSCPADYNGPTSPASHDETILFGWHNNASCILNEAKSADYPLCPANYDFSGESSFSEDGKTQYGYTVDSNGSGQTCVRAKPCVYTAPKARFRRTLGHNQTLSNVITSCDTLAYMGTYHTVICVDGKLSNIAGTRDVRRTDDCR